MPGSANRGLGARPTLNGGPYSVPRPTRHVADTATVTSPPSSGTYAPHERPMETHEGHGPVIDHATQLPHQVRGARFARRGSVGDLGAKDERGRYRDYTFDEGYIYRYYKKDGTILLMQSPVRAYPTGKEVGKGTTAYNAIKASIGTHRQQNAASVISTITSAVAATQAKPKTGRRKVKRIAPEEDDYPMELPSTSSTTPWGWIAGGVGVSVVVLMLALRR